MSRIRLSLIILLALILLAIAGPKVNIDTSWEDVQIPQDVESWLETSEASAQNLRPELHKEIIWADSTHRRTKYSVVYLHGFSSSRHETNPFADSIAAALHANLFYTRLSGHGQDGEAMGKATAHEWIQDTVESIRICEAIGSKVILVGTSTGVTLAAWASLEPKLQSNLVAQVWVSPNFGPKDERSKMLLWPWGRQLMQVVQGDTYSYTTQNELHAAANTQEFGSDVLLEMMGLVDTVQKLDFSGLKTPVFMVYSPTDQVINHDITLRLLDEMDPALVDTMVVLRALDVNNHVIVGEALGPENTMPVAHRAIDFLQGRLN